MTLLQVVAVVLLGTLVGLDVASVPQAMYSRPLVAGLLGGAAVGRPLAGLAVGAILELFAMDVLPVGASRYPDWGPGAVAIGAIAGAHQGVIMASGLLGLVLVAVVSAWVAGALSHVVRRANVATVEALRDALDAGDVRAVLTMQRRGVLRDAGRGFAVTALTLAVGDLVSTLLASEWTLRQTIPQATLVAASVGVALHGGWRLAGSGRQALWFAGGLAAGSIAVVLWVR